MLFKNLKMEEAQMKSLIGKRVRVMWTRPFKNLEGTVAKVEEHMVSLIEVKDVTMGKEEPDRWINTRCETFQNFVILEKEKSLAI